jgi:aminoglycoside/choline kinase family phosphotransferase
MAVIEIPAGPKGITAHWLTEALRSSGVLGRGSVASVRAQAIARNQGFAGQVQRMRIDYDDGADAPRSLIAKLHSPVPSTRELLRDLGAPTRELRFYKELARTLELRTPRLYYGNVDPVGGTFILLLEDLAPARVGDPVVGCSADQILDALKHAAMLHARSWNSPELASIDWIPTFETLATKRHALSGQFWNVFTRKYRSHFPSSFLAVSDRLRRGLEHARHRLSALPPTLLHGDFRPDNLLFPSTDAGGTIAAVDWQVTMRGPGVCDVAYFLAACGPAELRRELESEALEAYAATLATRGVRGYSHRQCVQDYQIAMIDILARVSVLTVGLVPRSSHGRAVFAALAERVATAVVDLDCAELLPD